MRFLKTLGLWFVIVLLTLELYGAGVGVTLLIRVALGFGGD